VVVSPQGHGVFFRWKNENFQSDPGEEEDKRTQKQKEFAAEQKKQNDELTALHKKNHRDRYDKDGNPKR
jgi:hypothetical protein